MPMTASFDPMQVNADYLAEEDYNRGIRRPENYLEQDRIVSHVMGVKARSEQYHQGRRVRWLDFFGHYSNKRRTRTKSSIPAPLSSEAVDVTLAEMMTRQFTAKPYCAIRGRFAEDEPMAQVLEDLLQYQFDNMDFFEIYYALAKNALIYGSAPYRVIYDRKMISVPSLRGDEPDEIIEYEGPVIIPYDPFDYYPAPEKLRPNDYSPSVTVSYKSYEHLVQKADMGVYENVHLIRPKRMAPHSTDFDARDERRAAMGMAPESAEYGLIEVMECDTWWPVGRDEHGNIIKRPFIMTVANGQLIRAERNTYIDQEPGMGLVRIDFTGADMLGVGLVEKLHPHQHGANSVLDMILNNLSLLVDKMMVVNKKSITDESELYNRSGGVIHTTGPVSEALRWFDGSDITPSAFVLLNMFQSFAESDTGVKPIKKGIISNETATATMGALSQANTRFQLFMMMMDHTLVRYAAKRMHRINQQFLETPSLFRVVGDDIRKWRQVDRATLAINPDFIPEGATRVANSEIRISQIEKMILMVSKVPGGIMLIPKLIAKLAREFNWQDAEEMEQIMTMGAQQAMAAMAMEQGGGGAPAPGAPGNEIPDRISGVGANNLTSLIRSQRAEGNAGGDRSGMAA